MRSSFRNHSRWRFRQCLRTASVEEYLAAMKRVREPVSYLTFLAGYLANAWQGPYKRGPKTGTTARRAPQCARDTKVPDDTAPSEAPRPRLRSGDCGAVGLWPALPPFETGSAVHLHALWVFALEPTGAGRRTTWLGGKGSSGSRNRGWRWAELRWR